MDYEGDVDFFVFKAVEGGSYKFEVALGTLDDSVLSVYDGDGAQVAYNDDWESSTASYLVWTAPAAGDYFVEVGGYGQAAGSYILAVGASDMAADDSQVRGRARGMADRAAGIVVGMEVEGVLEPEGEADFFVFGAVEGGLYELEVVLGTLSDSVLAVYGGDGVELAYNDDRADSTASYLVWTAPAAGDYFVEVSGFEDAQGSYTLTVAAPEAVRVALGEGFEGVLESDGEADFFVFGAVEGELYELEVVRGDHDGAVLDLYHPGGVESAYNQLFWRAPATGDHYLRVSGYGTGAYILTVSD